MDWSQKHLIGMKDDQVQVVLQDVETMMPKEKIKDDGRECQWSVLMI